MRENYYHSPELSQWELLSLFCQILSFLKSFCSVQCCHKTDKTTKSKTFRYLLCIYIYAINFIRIMVNIYGGKLLERILLLYYFGRDFTGFIII